MPKDIRKARKADSIKEKEGKETRKDFSFLRFFERIIHGKKLSTRMRNRLDYDIIHRKVKKT